MVPECSGYCRHCLHLHRVWSTGQGDLNLPIPEGKPLLFHFHTISISGEKYRTWRKKVMDEYSRNSQLFPPFRGLRHQHCISGHKVLWVLLLSNRECLPSESFLGSALWISLPAEQAGAGSSHRWHLAWRMLSYVNISFRNLIHSLNERCKFADLVWKHIQW